MKSRYNLIFATAVAAVIIGYVLWQTNHLGGQYWDYDEGVWAIEARLLNQGFHLYRDIYTPAPPLFVAALAAGFRLLGDTIQTARLVSLLLATLGLLPVALIGSYLHSRLAGLLAILFLALAPDFFLFARVPNGNQASLAIFMGAILFALYYRDTGQRRWLWLSSITATVSLFFKFVPFFLVPVLGVLVAWRHFGDNRRPQWRPFLIAAGQAAVPFAAMLLATLLIFDARPFIDQVFLHHLSGRTLPSAPPEFFFQPLNPVSASIVQIFTAYGAQEWPPNLLGNLIFFLINYQGLTVLALAGLLALWQHNPTNFAFVLIWLVATLLMTALHQPMFIHLYTVWLYPLAILAGAAVARLAALVISVRRTKGVARFVEMALFGAVLGVYLSGMPALANYVQRHTAAPNNPTYTAAINLIRQTTEPEAWVITDIQYLAFAANRKVPPELAETSRMRLANQRLALAQLQQWTTTYQPQIVITGRVFREIPGYNDWLAQSYSLVWGDDQQRFYVYRRSE